MREVRRRTLHALGHSAGNSGNDHQAPRLPFLLGVSLFAVTASSCTYTRLPVAEMSDLILSSLCRA